MATKKLDWLEVGARKLASELVADRQRGWNREIWYYQQIRDFAKEQVKTRLRAAKESGHLRHLLGCAFFSEAERCDCGMEKWEPK